MVKTRSILRNYKLIWFIQNDVELCQMLQDKLREQLGACEQKHTLQMSLIINEHKLTV